MAFVPGDASTVRENDVCGATLSALIRLQVAADFFVVEVVEIAISVLTTMLTARAISPRAAAILGNVGLSCYTSSP